MGPARGGAGYADAMANEGPARTQAALRRWHALGAEAPLDPARPIVDAHVHLWDRPPALYAGAELAAEIAASGHDVRATCFVECGGGYRTDGPEAERAAGETAWVEGVAAPARCAAIVAYADLRRPDLDRLLDAHQAASPRLRGIRQQAQQDPALGAMTRRPVPADLLADPAFRNGLRRLGARGLSFDAWVYFTQLEALAALAGDCPDTMIVVDHLGGPVAVGPYAADRPVHFARWRKGIAALASCPNVVMKIGGMGMPAFGHGFDRGDRPPASAALAAAWRPHVDSSIALFGAERCMFESNYPVDASSCGYGNLWNAFKRLAADASSREQDALFAGTAGRVYRIARGEAT